jgi:hypothetical protein
MEDGHPQLIADVGSSWSYLVCFDLGFLLVEKQLKSCAKNDSFMDPGLHILWGITRHLYNNYQAFEQANDFLNL